MPVALAFQAWTTMSRSWVAPAARRASTKALARGSLATRPPSFSSLYSGSTKVTVVLR
ncbi:hypothetical protein D3C87_1989870 [compost metagenome]